MARGTWEDFTTKYGFSDGGMLENRDFQARKFLVRKLNEQPEMKAAGIRALEFDRPGVHNSCLILFANDVPGKSDDELLKEFDFANEPDLPEMAVDLYELISDAYDSLDKDS